jgi:hypothetical protein
MINLAPQLAQGDWSMDRSSIIVEACAGAKGEKTPWAFTHEGSRRSVTEIVTSWYTEAHGYFHLQADDGHRYALRHNLDTLIWELVMCESTDSET